MVQKYKEFRVGQLRSASFQPGQPGRLSKQQAGRLLHASCPFSMRESRGADISSAVYGRVERTSRPLFRQPSRLRLGQFLSRIERLATFTRLSGYEEVTSASFLLHRFQRVRLFGR